MFLLPNSNIGFSETSYWNTFFKQRGKHPFEWYGDYTELCGILHRYVKPNDKLLVIGCGNSALSATLYDIGYKSITNIDVSEVVVNQMQQKYCRKRPGLSYHHMDATQTTFNDNFFTSILDKGTLDSLFTENNVTSRARVMRLLDEIGRIMANCGRYVCFSLLQDFILEFLLDYFSDKCWLIRVCRCTDIEKKRTDSSCLPVFSLVCIKLKSSSLINKKCILELSLDEKTVRKIDRNELIQIVKSVQHAEIVCDGISRNNLTSAGGEAIIEVSRAEDQSPRYKIIIKDNCEKKNPTKMTFAAFIVPQGREQEWVFCSMEGREILQKNCNTDRLAIVLLNPEHKYPDFKEIQEELSDSILKLAPEGALRKSSKIPFMTCGEEKGSKNIIFEDKSDISGHFKIQDVEEDNKIYRRLIFSKRPQLTQSEIRLKLSDDLVDENGEKLKIMDYSYVSCDYHILVNIGLALVSPPEDTDQTVNVLLIGLGGGVLTNFITRFFSNIYMDAVEIDPKVVDVACTYFDLKINKKINVIIKDGINFLAGISNSGQTYDAIIFDIDNKDITCGISCPPQIFVQDEVLSNVLKCLKQGGLFIMNMVCRSLEMRSWVVERILNYFPNAIALKTTEDVNEVLFCRQLDVPFLISELNVATERMRNIMKDLSIDINEELINITKTLKFLNV